MFSFFPCLPYKSRTKGFPRPVIEMMQITDNLTRGCKYTHLADIEEARNLWMEVEEQVRNKGLMLGTYAELPKACMK